MIWSKEQEIFFDWVVTETQGHAVLTSVAGSGKTTTIVEALNRSRCPESLYCVFGKKNQLEAEKKILNPHVSVLTYHSLGYRILLKHWRGVRGSSYAEFGRCKSLFPEAPKQVHFQVARLVSFLKNLFVTPTEKDVMSTIAERDIDAGNHTDNYPSEKLCEMALACIKLSLTYPKDKLISYEDMFYIPLRLGFLKPTYQLIFSDESNDCNIPQLEMLKTLCKPNGRICLVLDPKQAIFYFRGSMQDASTIFKTELKAREFKLSVSYRCPKKIVNLAQLLVPYIQSAPNAIEGEVFNMNEEKMIKEVKAHDIILSRTNFPLVKHCLALIKHGKPSYILGREIGKDLIDIVNSLEANSIVDFNDKLQKWRDNKAQSATGWLATRMAAIYQDKYDCLKVLAENCLEVYQIEEKINKLFFDTDYVRVPSTILSTVHKFKGNQAENIYILSETFKSGRRKLSPQLEIEENNIYYTAITRSQKTLTFVSTK